MPQDNGMDTVHWTASGTKSNKHWLHEYSCSACTILYFIIITIYNCHMMAMACTGAHDFPHEPHSQLHLSVDSEESVLTLTHVNSLYWMLSTEIKIKGSQIGSYLETSLGQQGKKFPDTNFHQSLLTPLPPIV